MLLIMKLDLKEQPIKCAVKSLPGNDWKMSIFAYSLFSDPGEIVEADVCTSNRNGFFAIEL